MMANIENLKKGTATQFQKGASASEAGRKGGIASGASRRHKKFLRELLRELLEENEAVTNT